MWSENVYVYIVYYGVGTGDAIRKRRTAFRACAHESSLGLSSGDGALMMVRTTKAFRSRDSAAVGLHMRGGAPIWLLKPYACRVIKIRTQLRSHVNPARSFKKWPSILSADMILAAGSDARHCIVRGHHAVRVGSSRANSRLRLSRSHGWVRCASRLC